ncbi:MAG TPA: HupE/UreJ family protein [Dongiaceae bacterium]|jgi:urease accessory protein|nr:HupE/UreJ family protein [Dongiaceae bacterium]
MRLLVLSALLLSLVEPALAHPGHNAALGFSAGLLHPFSGWDHLLAMSALGYWAARRSQFLILAGGNLLAMVGGVMAAQFVPVFPGSEFLVAFSAALVFLCALRPSWLGLGGALGIGLFNGSMHGLVHGFEIPAASSGLAYGTGFLIASAALHGIGWTLTRGGLAYRKRSSNPYQL